MQSFAAHCAALSILLCIGLAAVSRAAGIEVRTLGASGGPASAICERCADGDLLVASGALEVVIGGSHRSDESFYKFRTADALGSIVFFRPAGSAIRGDIMLGTPYTRVGDTTRHVRYERVEIQRSGPRVRFVATAEHRDPRGARLRFVGRYDFAPDSGRVAISLTATNVGSAPVEDLVYSLFFDPHQIYDFSPADAPAHRALAFRGYPRESRLIGWVDETPRLAVSDYHWGWDGGMILPDPLAVSLEPGQSQTRRYALVAGNDHRAVLESLYEEVGAAAHAARFEFQSASTDYLELVVRDAASSAVFFRSFLDRPASISIALLAGDYAVRANFFPGVAECSLSVSERGPNRCRLRDPPQGRAALRIVDSAGAFVPGKVSFRGIAPTPSPYFRPVNPTHDDGYWESHKNSAFPDAAGSAVALPVGSYRVIASRGPEYSIDEATVVITEGETAELAFRIDRAIQRPDLISVDPHLHTLESDGSVDVKQRIRSIVAEGVDVAIATDHNLPVDYGPALEELGLRDQLIVLAGAEVTVPERLDYNTYPMAVQPDEHNHGAIDALSTDLSSRFRASRARDPGVVLQINHPRSWQFDYFNWHALDPESAAFAREGFDLTFDVLEVVNGADYDRPDNRATRRDWLNLLRRGHFFPLVGTSDSHEIDRDEPGYSRTYVYRGAALGAPADPLQLMQRIREGRSFASNGPILDLVVSDRYRPGDTLTAVDGEVAVGLEVWSAPWIEASEVRLYVNGEPREVAMRPIAHPSARYFRGDLALRLDRDAYLVAEVRGSRSLSPVVQRESTDEAGVLPYALTNPIFVDVDGNGVFDPPLPREIEIRAIDSPAGPASWPAAPPRREVGLRSTRSRRRLSRTES